MRNGSSNQTEAGKKGALLAALFVTGTVLLSALYRKTACEVFLPLAITCGTISYHAVMRLLVGFVFRFVMQNQADYDDLGRYYLEELEVSKVPAHLQNYIDYEA